MTVTQAETVESYPRLRDRDPFHGPVVEVAVGDLRLAPHAGLVGREPVVLGGHVDAVPDQVAHRVVGAAVAELELVRLPAHREREDLVS